MTQTKIALLPDRGVVSVSGDDAEKLLQGFLTNDMRLLADRSAIYSALCTPQGKILFDLFVVKTPTGFILETSRDQTTALVNRMEQFKLRAKADIKDVSSDYTVAAIWGGPYAPHGRGKQPIWFADPRLPEMGYRELVTIGSDWALAGDEADSATADDYHAHRIALGVPEGGKDYSFGDTFPHEALFDQLNGVSFKKGCFVGQEVVARMQYRTVVRKRIVPIVGESALPAPGAQIMAGSVEIGKLGSVEDGRGLALVRLDRAAEFKEKGVPLQVGTVPVHIELPSWVTFSLEPKAAAPSS